MASTTYPGFRARLSGSPLFNRFVLALSLGAMVLTSSACIPLAAVGVVTAAKMVSDRRSVGAQTEDPSIEFKVFNAIQRGVKEPGGISASSFNRRVLLVGQVVDEQAKRDAEKQALSVSNVRMVFNELQITGRIGLGTRTTDTVITTKVKASILETPELSANHVTVVTDSGVVYLMGIVTKGEGERAAQVASRVSGVQKVVTVFETIAEAEAAAPAAK
jgi:osmotically-inducible protein OsmY